MGQSRVKRTAGEERVKSERKHEGRLVGAIHYLATRPTDHISMTARCDPSQGLVVE